MNVMLYERLCIYAHNEGMNVNAWYVKSHMMWNVSYEYVWCMMTWNGTKGAGLTMRNSGPIYAKHKLNASEW